MRFSTSLKKNHEFRRLYNRGKSSATPNLAVYCRRNGRGENRLGITVSTKLGGAVVRNLLRRRIKEAYRINEHRLKSGYDIVVVARVRARGAHFRVLEADLLRLLNRLGVSGDAK